jgi:hypothetical protein
MSPRQFGRDAGFHDRTHRLQVAGDCALHIVGAGTVNPLVIHEEGLGLVTAALKNGFLAAVGRIDMSVEQQLEPAAGAAQLADGVVTAFADFLKLGLEAHVFHVTDEKSRCFGLMPRRRRYVDKRSRQLDQAIALDVGQHFLPVAFAYRHSLASPLVAARTVAQRVHHVKFQLS